jgi:hypothetical protein
MLFLLVCIVKQDRFFARKKQTASGLSCKGFHPLTPTNDMEKTEQPKRSKGRPSKAEQSKNERLTCRFTAQEYAALETKAERVGLKITQLGRELILKGKVTNLFSAEEQTDKKQLIGLSNNLNQIAKNLNYFSKNFNMKEVSKQVLKIDDYLDTIDEILKKYKQ